MFYLWAVNLNGETVARFFHKEQAETAARDLLDEINKKQNKENRFENVSVSVVFC